MCTGEEQIALVGDGRRIVILGLGNLLYTDEGFGTQLVQRLEQEYDFPENVSVIDGGVLGLRLVNVLAEADQLIVIDTIKSTGAPGSIYRLEGSSVTERMRSKNSMHEVDFLETLSVCRLMGSAPPDTVLICVEPQDMETMGIKLTPSLQAAMEHVIELIDGEIRKSGAVMTKRTIH